MKQTSQRTLNYMSEDVTRIELQKAITDLQRKVEKTIKLDETVLKQEDVILKMENLLKKYQLKEALERRAEMAAPHELPSNEEVLVTLTKHNNCLHMDLLRMKDAMEAEKIELKMKMERAENRQATLEQELIKNAHEWARERNKLLQKLADIEKTGERCH